jgi:hypothetical protein
MKTGLVIAVAAGLGVVYYIATRPKAPMQAATPGAANIANNPSGGTLATLGSWLGTIGKIAGQFDPSSTGTDRSTPIVGAAVISNPVAAVPTILPYNYKQATVDVPALLGTDDLFTPGYGSSGAYSEDDSDGTAAGPTSSSYWA